MKIESEIIIEGRVQGVNFRRRISKNALELGLAGTIENLLSGDVKILVQGEKDQISELLNRILKLPFPVEIKNISTQFKPIIHTLNEFIIIKDPSFISDQIKAVGNLGKNLFKIKVNKKIPTHIVIIPDGNRRWAESHGLKASIGHKVGGDFDRLFKFFLESKNLGIRYLSFWIFSTENWKRSKSEVKFLFQIFSDILIRSQQTILSEGIKFRIIGRRDRIPKDLLEKLTRTEEISKNNTKLNVQFLIDYGGRDEIVRTVNKIIKKGIKEISEDTFSLYLDTADIPDPDLIIRTSGEQRISGLLPYQSTYSELFFSPKLFPDFNSIDLRNAVESFGNRNRRFGGTKNI